MFSDADLLGVPVRLVISPRNMKESVAELSSRDKTVQEKIPLDQAVSTVKNLIHKMKQEVETSLSK